MQRLLDGFCKKKGLNPSELQFVFDGKILALHETPESLEMENDDLIDAQPKLS